jgi:hypothetical protein
MSFVSPLEAKLASGGTSVPLRLSRPTCFVSQPVVLLRKVEIVVSDNKTSKWYIQNINKFLDTYEQFELLWNARLEDYMNKNTRDSSFQNYCLWFLNTDEYLTCDMLRKRTIDLKREYQSYVSEPQMQVEDCGIWIWVHLIYIYIYTSIYIYIYTWRSWWRHCATNRKVTGSITDGVTGIFHSHNPFGRTVALGSTQNLTEISTRNIYLGVKAAGA